MKIYVINENTCTRVKLYGMDVINLFKINGWEIVKEKEEADYIAINTCSFLNSKAAYFLSKVKGLYNDKKKNQKIMIIGCLGGTNKSDIDEISKELYFFTGGYPFLVSWICKWIDEQGEGKWTRENIRKAEKSLQLSGCTLLDDVSKNYENNQELQKMIDQMLFCGKKYSYTMNDPVIRMGSILGILKEKDGQVAIKRILD